VSDQDDDDRARALIKKAMASRRAAAPADPAPPPDEADDFAHDDDLPPDPLPSARPGLEQPGSADQPDEPEPVSASPSSSPVVVDDVDLKDALRGALRPPAGAVAPNLLKGVQRKLRVRSRGKFYGDGWSTAESPKTTYLITAIIMLVLIAVLFFALVPWSSTSL
jgi:hypothetical protein